MRGATRVPGSFGSLPHARHGAGWRRADRLVGYSIVPAAPIVAKDPNLPLDSGEKSAIVKSVDANVPPDQPPSTVDSPVSLILWRGLSATGIVFEPSTLSPSRQSSVTSPGCGVTPPGLT